MLPETLIENFYPVEKKVNKQKIREIRGSYWLFTWAERDTNLAIILSFLTKINLYSRNSNTTSGRISPHFVIGTTTREKQIYETIVDSQCCHQYNFPSFNYHLACALLSEKKRPLPGTLIENFYPAEKIIWAKIGSSRFRKIWPLRGHSITTWTESCHFLTPLFSKFRKISI